LTTRLLPLSFLVLAWAMGSAGCAKPDPGANRRRTQVAVLRRQIVGLRDLVAAAEKGEIANTGQVLIGIEEKLLTELVNANLPPEIAIADRLRVKISQAEVRFRATTSIVLLRARLGSVSHADRFADVLLGGGLEEVQIEPATGRLTARIGLFHIEVEKTSGHVLAPLVATLIEEVGPEGLDLIAQKIPPVEIPVRLEPEIRIPGFGNGPVTVAPGMLPIKLVVARVAPVSGRLWIVLDASAGPWQALAEPTPSPAASPAPTPSPSAPPSPSVAPSRAVPSPSPAPPGPKATP
jgi:hypothetical protein